MLSELKSYGWLCSTTTIPLICITLLATLGYIYYDQTYNKVKRHFKLDGPTPWPLIGNLNLYLARAGKRRDYELEWPKKYGKLYLTFVGSESRLVVADHDIARILMARDSKSFLKHSVNYPELMTQDKFWWVFYLTGERWRKAREFISPFFSLSVIKATTSKIEKCIDEFVDERLANEWQLANNSDFGISYLMSSLGFDIFTRCFFSFEIQKKSTSTKSDKAVKYVDSNLGRVADKILHLFQVPLTSVYVYHLLPNFLLRAMGVLDEHKLVYEYISKTVRSNYSKRKHHVNDFLHNLIQAEGPIEYTKKFVKGARPNDDLIEFKIDSSTNDNKPLMLMTKPQVDMAIISTLSEAMETNGAMRTHTMYCLAHHRHIQDKLRDTLKSILSDSSKSDESIYTKLAECHYLNAVIYETFRTMGTVVAIDRVATEDYFLHERGFKIPKDQIIYIDFHAIHHDPDVYENPHIFDPDRFMPGNAENIPSTAFIPFGFGPRQCVGITYAMTEIRLLVTKVVLKYKILPVANTSWPPMILPTINLRVYEPLQLEFETIEKDKS